MSIEIQSEDVLVITLPAEPEIRKVLDNLLKLLQEGRPYDVVVDFSVVDIMTSLTLSGFLKLRELLANRGRRLIFSNTAPITKDIFRTTCFTGLFDFIDDKAEALSSLTAVKK